MNQNFVPCPLPRRLAALLYDAVLLFGVEVMAFIPYTMLRHGTSTGSFDPLALLWMLGIAYLFFGWFWVHGGQTLGMRTWGIRVQTHDGKPVSWLQALLRFGMAMVSWAVLGLGFWWALWDKDRLTWHDRWSESVLVKPEKK